jgi:hypothetical protein
VPMLLINSSSTCLRNRDVAETKNDVISGKVKGVMLPDNVCIARFTHV